MQQALIQTFLINIIIIHINEAITLTIPFQLVISLFNLILKISIHPLCNTWKTNTHFTTVFLFLNGFRYFTTKMFLLYSINWRNFIVWLPLLLDISGNMCIAIVC